MDDLYPITIDFSNGMSSKTVFVSADQGKNLIKAWNARQQRYPLRCKFLVDEKEEHTLYCDLMYVSLIQPLRPLPE